MHIGYYYPAPFPSLNADIVHIVQMCRAFASLGHEVTLFIPRVESFPDDDSALQETYKLFGAPLGFNLVFISRQTFFGRMQMLGSLRSAKRALREHVLDLIYTRAPWACLMLPWQNVPFIYEAHEVEIHKNSKLITWILQRVVVRAAKSSACRRFVVISAALGSVWRSLGVPVHKLAVAHDAVDLELFDNGISKSDARKAVGITSHRTCIVYTGSLYPDRGIDKIVRAAAAVPAADFYIVGGSAAEVEIYRSLADGAKIRNIFFIGQVPHREIPTWLAAADILLMMWTWQVKTIAICSPMKLFEYMAANRLIVGPAFPTVKEVVRHNEHAILFEPDNEEKMVAALNEALDTYPTSPLPARARALVAKEYTWSERARSVLE